MLGFQEPLDYRTSCYTTGVLDLSGKSHKESPWDSPSPSPPSNHPSSPPSTYHPASPTSSTPPPTTISSPRLSVRKNLTTAPLSPIPTPPLLATPSPVPRVPSFPEDPLTPSALAITQRVLAAATAPHGTRPFKAYPKDPLSLPSTQSDAYLYFRQQVLNQQVKGSKYPKKRPSSPLQAPSSSGGDSDDKDAAYWEKRRKNNEAAKRSRDARRAKEDEIAIRAAFLEQENLRLKYQIAALTQETSKLRCLVYKGD